MSPQIAEVFGVWIKRLAGAIGLEQLFSGHPELTELDLDRDYLDVERLLMQEEWPFVRADLEVSHQQPKATAFAARKDGQFAGFFAAHNFGSIGYLDMMIIATPFRGAAVARPLYFRTMHELKRKGIRSFVVHTTNDSARLIRLIGFRPGRDFTLVVRDAQRAARGLDANISRIGMESLNEVIALDAAAFGMQRAEWITALLRRSDTPFFGLRRDGRLTASLCLRPRRGDAFSIDTVNCESIDDLARLVQAVAGAYGDHRLECFARTGSPLHHQLEQLGFTVPEFFKAIGPLVEWRKGPVGTAGTSDAIQCLCWF